MPAPLAAAAVPFLSKSNGLFALSNWLPTLHDELLKLCIHQAG